MEKDLRNNTSERKSQDGSDDNCCPEEFPCCDDFEYIETFLPRNIEY